MGRARGGGAGGRAAARGARGSRRRRSRPRQGLSRSLDRHGAQHVVLLIRTILESEGQRERRPEWPGRGLAWIEAFDNVPLMALLRTMQDLELFRPSTIDHYFFLVLRNRLRKVFEPPKVTTVKPPRKANEK